MTENILGSGMKEGGPVPCSIEGVSAKCRPFLPTAASDAREVAAAATRSALPQFE
jgi:hypothetical protein